MEKDGHYYLKFALALRLCCYSWEEAWLIASADWSQDTNDSTVAGFGRANNTRWHALGSEEERRERREELVERIHREPNRRRKLIKLGQLLHFVEDWHSHAGFNDMEGHGIETFFGYDPDSLAYSRENNIAIVRGSLHYLSLCCEPPRHEEEVNNSVDEILEEIEEDGLIDDLMERSDIAWKKFIGLVDRQPEIETIIEANARRIFRYVLDHVSAKVPDRYRREGVGANENRERRPMEDSPKKPAEREIPDEIQKAIEAAKQAVRKVGLPQSVTFPLRQVSMAQAGAPLGRQGPDDAGFPDFMPIDFDEAGEPQRVGSEDIDVFAPQKLTPTELPPEKGTRKCVYRISLVNVAYEGGDEGNDWKFNVKVGSDGRWVRFPERKIEHKSDDDSIHAGIEENPLYRGCTACESEVTVRAWLNAAEVDWPDPNEPGRNSASFPFKCDGSRYEPDVTVDVDSARLIFSFLIETACLEDCPGED